MKKMIMALLTACSITGGASAFAVDTVRSYTVEEMHRMASAYITLVDRENSKIALSFDSAIEAGEFKGYVASSLLDNGFTDNDKVAACKSRLTVQQVAHKSALSIAGRPATGLGDAGKRLRFAVLLACSEGA